MDKTSKKILNAIISAPDQVIIFDGIYDPLEEIASPGKAEASLLYLSDKEYIALVRNESDGTLQKATISYRTLHPIRYWAKKLLSYVTQNWIAIAALIISVIALLKQ